MMKKMPPNPSSRQGQLVIMSPRAIAAISDNRWLFRSNFALFIQVRRGGAGHLVSSVFRFTAVLCPYLEYGGRIELSPLPGMSLVRRHHISIT